MQTSQAGGKSNQTENRDDHKDPQQKTEVRNLNKNISFRRLNSEEPPLRGNLTLKEPQHEDLLLSGTITSITRTSALRRTHVTNEIIFHVALITFRNTTGSSS